MAITKNLITGNFKGRVGDLVFYKRQGRTMVRNAKNTNAKPSHTMAQQRQRIRFANCVTLSKSLLRNGACCYADKAAHSSDYNAFIGHNATLCNVYLPREMTQQGFSWPFEGMVLATGTLPSIDSCGIEAGLLPTGLQLGELAIDAGTTMHQLADAAVMCNPDVHDGDVLVVVACTIKNQENPYTNFEHVVLQLNRSDFRPLASLEGSRLLCSRAAANGGQVLAVDSAAVPCCAGLAAFLCRWGGNGVRASPARLHLLPGFDGRFGSREAFDVAAESYGGFTSPEYLQPDFEEQRMLGEFKNPEQQ